MKILVVGASGMLGHQMWKTLNKRFPGKVFGTVRRAPEYYKKFESLDPNFLIGNVDALQFDSMKSCLENMRPQWIINCVGLTLRKPDLSDIEKCIEINSMLPHRLAIWAENHSSKLIHFSTDCVFDGKGGPYKESDLPTADDIYGKSKFLGETTNASSLTLRLSIIGRELETKSELVEWFLSQNDKAVKGYSKALYSGLTTSRVAKEVINIIENYPHLNGMYQIASVPISKYDLLCLLNRTFKIGAHITPFESYISNKILDCSRYSKETGFVPPQWSDMIAELAKNQSTDYGD